MQTSLKIENTREPNAPDTHDGYRAAIATVHQLINMITLRSSCDGGSDSLLREFFAEEDSRFATKNLFDAMRGADRIAFHLKLHEKRWYLKINARKEKRTTGFTELVFYANSGLLERIDHHPIKP